MTYSVFAVDANALSMSGCSAYTYALNGFLPYLREPWYQFSEQAVDDPLLNGDTNPAFPFLTGHGGANQAVPFGFLGIRTDQPVLYINPSLPPQIPYVKIRTFYYAGATLSATMNTTHTNISRIATPAAANLVDKYANTTLPFAVGMPNADEMTTSYTLATNQTLAIPNRLYWQNLTYASNLIQCQPVTSTSPYVAGQFPTAANDGATSTNWQPSTNASASLVINMTSVPFSPVTGVYFEWGLRPAFNATIFLGNNTDGSGTYENEIEIFIGDIAPTSPYNATQPEGTAFVEPVVGNSTLVDVAGAAWSGQYVRLVIEGCWEPDGEGATVGEFVLIGGN
jgi:hypothetical protein